MTSSKERPVTTDEQLLAGRVAVVTGSSRGIGLEVARALLHAGAAVVINGRDADVVDAAMADLDSDRVLGVAGSAADPKVVDTLVVEAQRLGRPSVVITCAGTAEPPGSTILNVEPSEWYALIDAHLHATFLTCRAFAPLLVEAGDGAIVTTGSHAFTGIFGGTGYPAGKGGVISLTYALAAELREHGVRVNAVCPGARTRLSEGAEYDASLSRLHDRGILDDLTFSGAQKPPPASHVAQLYLYLASHLARDVTGRIFVGSGGYVGEFPRPVEQLLTWRDHNENGPWRPDEIANAIDR